jgi:L-ectoine synthase
VIVRSVEEILGTPRDVHGRGWKSRRIILAGDGLEYSVHETTLEPGQRLRFQYRNHRETVYCVDGEGTVEDMSDGRVIPLQPGVLYSAGIGDDHVVTTTSEMKLICIFTPALVGSEEAD